MRSRTGTGALSAILVRLKDGDFGAISVTDRSCDAPISKVKSIISDRCCRITFRVGTKSYLSIDGFHCDVIKL